jgi:hypothetical protein
MWPFLSGLASSLALPALDYITSNATLSDRGIINTPKRNLKDRPVVNPSFMRPDYSGAGERARRFQEYKTGRDIPGANTDYSERLISSVGSPADRAYEQEKARATQLTEQDPLFKKYRVAELTKAYNTASPEDKEKIGLEIWATTNPQLAQKLKPGQLGYTQATSAVMSQSPLGQFQAQTGDMQYANKMDQVPAAMASFQPQTPLTGIQVPAVPQFGASEVFAKATPIPGATEMFTDPRKFLNQEELNQTKLALLKKAIESRLK